MPDTLLVVAKKPLPGQAKTRLCPPLTGEQAASLYECFLRDTLALMRRVPAVQRAIAYLPAGARGYFQQLAPDMDLTPQRGATLGERLDNLLTAALQGGAARVVVMDSDSPTLPVAYLNQAFARLLQAEVVIGPAQDGGYYLIGMQKPHPHLLRQVHMSTPHVLADTLALAESTGVSVALLPAWYDVDTVADLHRLHAEVTRLSRNGTAAWTRRWLAQSTWRDRLT
jgi:rSAM/selenodomain-associated transferase 1